MEKAPYIGGSKSKEKAILKYYRMSPKQRLKLLMLPSVKSKRTERGKFNSIINHIMRKG